MGSSRIGAVVRNEHLLLFLVNPHLRICLLILEREEEREKEREGNIIGSLPDVP